MEADDSFEEFVGSMNDDEIEQIANPTFELMSEFNMEERVPALDEKEVDDLAGLKHERKTKNQTKWGVKIFRGKRL